MEVAQSYLHGWMPDIDSALASAVKGTPLLQGGRADYWLALAIAVAFPLVRLLLDATVYDVSVTKCCFGAPGSPRCPRPRARP
jgi:hypothetical protein